MKNCVAIIVFCLLGIARAQAEDPPAVPQPTKHRVTGLFSPDRQQDLAEVVKHLPEVKLVSIDYETSEVTFLYDVDQLFNRPKPEQIVERFDNLLRSASNSTFGIRPLCTTPRDKLETIEITIVGLDCKACSLAAYEAIFKIDGVERATASFREGLVTAMIDPAKTNRAELEAALKEKNVELKAK